MKSRLLCLLALAPALTFAADAAKHINAAADVFNEIMATPDKGVPQDLLKKAECIGIVPGLKRAGFVVGAKYGKGVLVCRTASGRWSGPEVIRIEGGSIGLQIGAGETDLVFLIMNEHGQNKLLEDKFTIGGDVSAMAGPVGRTAEAQTDAMMHAEILSYSRARGVFAGISLEGSTLRPDGDENRELYGRDVTPKEILMGDAPRPEAARSLYGTLNQYVPGRS
jgi:SH3 domain-containing YSC84-like protein 1